MAIVKVVTSGVRELRSDCGNDDVEIPTVICSADAIVSLNVARGHFPDEQSALK